MVATYLLDQGHEVGGDVDSIEEVIEADIPQSCNRTGRLRSECTCLQRETATKALYGVWTSSVVPVQTIAGGMSRASSQSQSLTQSLLAAPVVVKARPNKAVQLSFKFRGEAKLQKAEAASSFYRYNTRYYCATRVGSPAGETRELLTYPEMLAHSSDYGHSHLDPRPLA